MTEQISNNHELVETLRQADPVLNPIELGKIFPSYKHFNPFAKKYGLWATLETLPRVQQSYFQQDNIILETSGVAAGGKDAIRETIERIIPGLSYKAVTATSRGIREGEVDGKDYYFYKNPDDFKASIERDEFVEWVPQGDRYYGLPKRSLSDALMRNEPIITTHVEMKSGWPAIDKLTESGVLGKKAFPLKVFVLPNMRFSEYADRWLPKRRDDVETRLLRAAWEISVAAERADFIVTNTIGKDLTALEWEAQSLVNICLLLLKLEESSGFNTFDSSFEISPGIGEKQQIVDYHAGVLNND